MYFYYVFLYSETTTILLNREKQNKGCKLHFNLRFKGIQLYNVARPLSDCASIESLCIQIIFVCTSEVLGY